MPGFIDAHTHLGGEIGPNMLLEPVQETEIDAAFKAVKNGRTTLMAGFTTVRDYGGQVTVALGHAVEKGVILAPRIVPSRNALGITGGHCDVTGYAPGILEQGPKDGVADGPWEVVEAVRYQIKHGAQVIKTCATAGVLSLEGPVGAQQYTYEEMKAMVDEAARHGVKVAAHAHGTEGIKAAVRAGVASIEHGSMLDDEAIALMKERGTYLVPTEYLSERINLAVLPPLIRRKAESVLPLARESHRKAIASGVKIAFGTDAAVFPHGENAKEFSSYVRLGMTPLAALRSATVNAADLLGKTDRGVIAPGKLADFVAVEGNPLENIGATERVQFVMLGGRVVREAARPLP
jgi:imidazolonepropionase-like amidohydrolase